MRKGIYIIAAVLILFAIGRNLNNATTIETVENCKVINLQALQQLSGSDGSISTNYRYLVTTDKETFICETSVLNGKYNNSDIYFRLQKDSTYSFKVEGVGKSMINDYRNILEIIK